MATVISVSGSPASPDGQQCTSSAALDSRVIAKKLQKWSCEGCVMFQISLIYTKLIQNPTVNILPDAHTKIGQKRANASCATPPGAKMDPAPKWTAPKSPRRKVQLVQRHQLPRPVPNRITKRNAVPGTKFSVLLGYCSRYYCISSGSKEHGGKSPRQNRCSSSSESIDLKPHEAEENRFDRHLKKLRRQLKDVDFLWLNAIRYGVCTVAYCNI